MQLNIKAFSLASGLFGALTAALCGGLIWILPKEATQFASWWSHIDLTVLARSVTLFSFLGSIIATFFIGLAAGAIFAWLYNKFVR